MSDPERLLTELWAADAPPERDPMFVLEVMQRVERRRLWLSLLAQAPIFVATCVALWAFAPVVRRAAEQLSASQSFAQIAPVAAILATAVFLWGWSADRAEV